MPSLRGTGYPYRKAIFNNIRCIDLLQSGNDVDTARIGITGHSPAGGYNAMFTAAFDTRFNNSSRRLWMDEDKVMAFEKFFLFFSQLILPLRRYLKLKKCLSYY